jgi:hypothetical protein
MRLDHELLIGVGLSVQGLLEAMKLLRGLQRVESLLQHPEHQPFHAVPHLPLLDL